MWRCSNCGESVEDDFDVCWNCGHDRDGKLHEDTPADDEQSCSCCPHHENDRIVELCSAANNFEAEAMCGALDRAGIATQLVGEMLGNAAGGLPLGETTKPRIWVYESDVPKAHDILLQYAENASSDLCEDAESEDLEEEEETPETPEDRFRFLGQGFYIVALICFLIGSVWAFNNWTILTRYSAVTEGRCVAIGIDDCKMVPIPDSPDLPIFKRYVIRSALSARYDYTVNGQTYYAIMDGQNKISYRVPIHYDPKDALSYHAGSIMPPWLILAFALGFAAIMSLVGYEFS